MSGKRVRRETSYSPPFSGGRAQPVAEYRRIHQRWIGKLLETWPEGVPAVAPLSRCQRCNVAEIVHASEQERRLDLGKRPCAGGPWADDPPWPATFGDEDAEGRPVHRADEGAGYCFQCGYCCYYVTLDASIGSDWGACTNPRSQYDGRVTYEHWSCREFTR